MEVYGPCKQDAVYAYTGQRAYRVHVGFWAEAGISLAADLMAGDADPRPHAVDLLDRALAQLPSSVENIRCRWDTRYFAVDFAQHCVEHGIEFAIGVKRNTAVVPPCAPARPRTGAPGDRHGLSPWSR